MVICICDKQLFAIGMKTQSTGFIERGNISDVTSCLVTWLAASIHRAAFFIIEIDPFYLWKFDVL